MWFTQKSRDKKEREKPPTEADKALEDATENLRQTQALTPEVRELSKALRVMRERNHFAEQLRVIMEGP